MQSYYLRYVQSRVVRCIWQRQNFAEVICCTEIYLAVVQGPYTVILTAGSSVDEQLLCLQVDFDVQYASVKTRAKQSLRTVAGRLGLGLAQGAAHEEAQPAHRSRAQA